MPRTITIDPDRVHLTDRQRRVLHLRATGSSFAEIAVQLGISEKMARATHSKARSKIDRKLR